MAPSPFHPAPVIPSKAGSHGYERASWRRQVEIPEGIHLEFLPSGSPELMPEATLWPLSNEALANSLFEELEQTLMHRCVQLLDQAELIAGLTNYHWWPQSA